MKESGYADFESYVWASFFVRSDTPDDITNKLYEGFKKVMASPEARTYQAGQPAKLMDLGPQDLKAFVMAEIERFKRVAQVGLATRSPSQAAPNLECYTHSRPARRLSSYARKCK
jgi:tripartite-type tricarboxylate transporter receptor subunit TctC